MTVIFYRTDFSASGLEMSWKALCDSKELDPETTEFIEVTATITAHG
jgi:hypothetical protein